MSESDQIEHEESCLREADDLVYGDRRGDYGHPYDDYSRTAAIFNAMTGRDLTPSEAVKFMVSVKLSRMLHRKIRDNYVDAAGYIECLRLVDAREAATVVETQPGADGPFPVECPHGCRPPATLLPVDHRFVIVHICLHGLAWEYVEDDGWRRTPHRDEHQPSGMGKVIDGFDPEDVVSVVATLNQVRHGGTMWTAEVLKDMAEKDERLTYKAGQLIYSGPVTEVPDGFDLEGRASEEQAE
jgi:hypothetical protein